MVSVHGPESQAMEIEMASFTIISNDPFIHFFFPFPPIFRLVHPEAFILRKMFPLEDTTVIPKELDIEFPSLMSLNK